MSDEPDSGRADGQNPLENTGAQESSMEREPATPDAIASEQQAKERSTRPGLVMLSGLLVAVAAFGTTLLTWVDARITGAFGEQSLGFRLKSRSGGERACVGGVGGPACWAYRPASVAVCGVRCCRSCGGWYRLERYCGDKQPCCGCGDRDQPPNRHNFSGRRVFAEPVAVGVGGVRCADYRGRAVGCVHLPHLGHRAQVRAFNRAQYSHRERAHG